MNIMFDEIAIDTSKQLFYRQKDQGAFWDDEHISEQMLKAHLNPVWDAASRKSETIDKSCQWLRNLLEELKMKDIVDLGCGPGLYCSKLASYGFNVTGVDFSKRSIAYAKEKAEEKGQRIAYYYQDYLELKVHKKFDMAMMIYCDFGALNDKDSEVLLQNVHNVLNDEGIFILDVWTPENKELVKEYRSFTSQPRGGFWAPTPYLELIEQHYFKENLVSVRKHTIMNEAGETTEYYLWERCYTLALLEERLNHNGFEIVKTYGNTMGATYTTNSPAMTVVARKVGC